jgi:hypothetical protein
MTLDDIYGKPLSLDDLGLFKTLEPLAASTVEELRKIEQLDVADFSEAEVRAFVIDPIVRMLGYAKGTDFSVELGKRIEFLDKNRFPDYKFTLWKDNFWLIEAKRPNFSESHFGYDDLAQAVEYAIHPEINAALVVLCDGRKIEIFDREVSLTAPVLHIEIRSLVGDFDKLRLLLEPWQVWFFQKRRIVRLIDKVFDKEFNLNRVEEFKTLVKTRLARKRTIILENFRRNVKPDTEEQKQHLLNAPLEELVDVHFFVEHSVPLTNALIEAMVARSQPNSFSALYRVFPDRPRDANDIYYPHALAYLMALGKGQPSVRWLPAWLAPMVQGSANIDDAIKRLMALCLTHFEADEARKVVLLACTTIRRIIKILMVSNEAQWRMGAVLHFVERYRVPEFSWQQIVSSPEGHLLRMIDTGTMMATYEFVRSCGGERSEFKTEVAKAHLRELWTMEKTLLNSVENYAQLRRERNLGDMTMTEPSSVTYDNLGHGTLCLMHGYPDWTDYAMRVHRAEIEKLASMHSWSAKGLLGLKPTDDFGVPPTESDLATRFFFGDLATLQALREGYAGLVG